MTVQNEREREAEHNFRSGMRPLLINAGIPGIRISKFSIHALNRIPASVITTAKMAVALADRITLSEINQ